MASPYFPVDMREMKATRGFYGIEQGRVKLDELITKRYPLEKINEAISAVVKGEALRNVIVFD